MPILKTVNKNFFKMWTSDMAYVLGFFAADGYITKNKRGGCFWSIQITDLDLLNQIKNIVESNHKIGVRSSKNSDKKLYRLQIGSQEMCWDLEGLGMRIKKTKTMSFPLVPDEYLNHFIRGYFDGDGHVWVGQNNKNRMNNSGSTITVGFTSSSNIFLIELMNKLKILGLKGGALVCRNTFFRLQYSVRDSVRLYHVMYGKIDNGLCLVRKKMIFEKYLSSRNAPVV